MILDREWRDTRGPCVLLETIGPDGSRSGHSILARRPKAILIADGAGARLTTAAGTTSAGADPLAALKRLLETVPPGRWPEEGGVAGALAYDFGRRGRLQAPTPVLVALAVDRFVVADGQAQVASDEAGDGWSAHHPLGLGPTEDGEEAPLNLPDLAPYSSLSPEAHYRLVLRIQEHIAAGDIYQANLSQRFTVPWRRGGARLYRALRRIGPAPFAGYLRAAGLEIVSASPERLLLVDGRRLSTRPIAGTRPRSAEPARDDALAAELILSEKERAEHLMLVDLARNDLGKVASLGSVRVDELMTLEGYSHVRHIVSNVTATLADGRHPFDALAALSPGGTITGVPKRRCMQILDALEPVPRGFYTGSLFYATPSGRLDANILIRSAVVTAGAVAFHAGGGIVTDSQPRLEYAETLHKAEGMRLALEAASRGE